MNRLLKTREIWLALAIIALVIGVTTRSRRASLSPGNLASIFNDTSILIILALGQMVVILTRSIDLSIAANVALSGMVIALVNQAYPGVPVPLLIVAAPLLGPRFWRHQRPSRLEARYPRDRGDAGHAHHLSRYDVPRRRWAVGECRRDDARLHRHHTGSDPSACLC